VREVSSDEDALRALLSGLAAEAPVRGARGGSLTFADVAPRVRQLFAPDLPAGSTIVPVGKDQSNTSARVGSTHVFKLFRRLEEGEHPQIEIGRFLGDIAFPAAPPLEGSITYVPIRGGACALGALEGWVQSIDDGWNDMVAGLGAVHDDADMDVLAGRLAALGTTTADFHLAMGSDAVSPAFAPELVTAGDRRVWQQALVDQGQRVVALVSQQAGHWTGTTGDLARHVAANRAGMTARLGLIAAEGLAGDCQKIRVHGDFHLGQTLRTRDGYVLIDFEGEPAKTIAERRRKLSALKDVAGMLRSIDYAVAAARADSPEARGARLDAGRLRDAFVGAYLDRASAGHVNLLPPTRLEVGAWMWFFELEKMLYEVEYETNNRPPWVHIPLAALVRALDGPSPAPPLAG
jgi:maltose alpha-D-glucosyltransferase/alpha-amylase